MSPPGDDDDDDNVDGGDRNICNCGEGGDEEDVKLENLVKTQVGVSFTFFLRNSSDSVGGHFHFLENLSDSVDCRYHFFSRNLSFNDWGINADHDDVDNDDVDNDNDGDNDDVDLLLKGPVWHDADVEDTEKTVNVAFPVRHQPLVKLFLNSWGKEKKMT